LKRTRKERESLEFSRPRRHHAPDPRFGPRSPLLTPPIARSRPAVQKIISAPRNFLQRVFGMDLRLTILNNFSTYFSY
jgi:hypothetical protein